MFTGIIDHCGKITKIQKQDNTLKCWIETRFNNLQPGESISVDGICLTVVEPSENQFACQLSPETCALTTAEKFQTNRLVNLERALRLLDRVGGHFVLGHVDQTAIVQTINTQNDFVELHITGFDKRAQSLAFKKGSIALNGVSLTINEIYSDGMQFMLVPHTLEKTTLHQLQIGDRVNVEYDWLVKMVSQQLATHPNNVEKV
jgi:riboflavin synthase